MKILLVMQDVALGGVQISTEVLGQALAARGHQVSIAYPHYDPDAPLGRISESRRNGLSIFQVAVGRRPRADIAAVVRQPEDVAALGLEYRDPAHAEMFRTLLEQVKPEVVHFQHLLGFSAAAVEVCREAGLPAFLSAGDTWLLCDQNFLLRTDGSLCSGPDSPQKCADCFFEHYPTLPRAPLDAAVVAHLQERREYLTQVFAQLTQVNVPTRFLEAKFQAYGMDMSQVKLRPFGLRPFEVKPPQPSADGKLRFAFLGAIAQHKGVDLAVHAFNIAHPSGARLDIFGKLADPLYFEDLMQHASSDLEIAYRGIYDSRRLGEILAHADAVIFPSRAETYPGVVRECRQAGVPVIAARVAGVPELIVDGVHGLLFEPNNAYDLAAKIGYVTDNPQVLAQFRAQRAPVLTVSEEAAQLELDYAQARQPQAAPESPAASGAQPVAEPQPVSEPPIAAAPRAPQFSVLTPVYNVEPQWLTECVQSVLAQTFTDWEMCLVDDGSTRPETRACLQQLGSLDPRLKVHFCAQNGGISAATNQALALAHGQYAVLLDNDDVLTPDALAEMAGLLAAHPDADLIYSDEDKLDAQGNLCDPFYKPDWSPELLHAYAYTCHLTVVRLARLRELGGFRSQFDGAQDYDLTLRLAETTDRIFHLPKVLYHWRMIPGSAAEVIDAKGWALEAGRQALAEHLLRTAPGAQVLNAEGAPGCFRVRYALSAEPRVSILIPIRGQKTGAEELLYRCVRSIEQKTDYRNFELVVAYNNDLDPEIAAFFVHHPARLLNFPLAGAFNFARKINFMAAQAEGEYLVIFNDDLEVISPEWLSALLEHAQHPEVGAVGSKLLYPDERLQHVGMVLGINGYPAHIFHQARPGHPGYRAHANLVCNYSAVTGAAMMIRKSRFEELGGMDETYATDYNDTDLCLRLGERGYRVVYTPYARLYHHESAAISSGRLQAEATQTFRARWARVMANDPYYNPNLPRTRLDYGLGN